ncbi:MAG: phospho-sugar mutase, partial [Acidimicrobiia bacterium]|nr:phospho-sugar mutase [Acidimicrobiia bacterium]
DIVYTPLHGVGAATLLDIFSRTAHDSIHPVPAQVVPDGTFPTVSFPNPEEPGALDMALELAADSGSDLVIANDPDADRLAAAVPGSSGWRLLTGNELGVILADYLLSNWTGPERAITACSVVSSPMLASMSEKFGALHLTTLTGFKWIANAALSAEADGHGVFLFGFEEALGYTVGRTVRDKDGISAALILADIAAAEKANGRTLLDRLAALWEQFGIWVSTQASIRKEGPGGAEALVRAVDQLAASAPDRLGGFDVTAITDFRVGADERPWWLGAQDLVELSLGESGRILVRPSGTEPKLKIYVDLRGETGMEPERAHVRRTELLEEANALAAAAEQLVGSLIGG